MLIDVLKEALRLMKKNMNLTQLVFLLFILVTIFIPVMAGVKLNVRIIPMVVLFFAVLCAFFAGLFFAFKKSLDYDTNPPKSDNIYDLPPLYFAEFFQGVGKYTKTFIFAGILVLLILFLTILTHNYIIDHYIGIPQSLINAARSGILNDNAQIINLINSLSPSDQTKILKLSSVTLLSMCFFGYITVLYPVILVTEEKNFFISFFESLRILAKNMPISIIIFIFFNLLLTIAGMAGAVFANSIILSVICILLQCYLNVWYILSLFVYYEKTK
ncbi:MAG: hypothetical protein K6A44_04980 [bacterium]|nr:hypothetical protein [bacterium]